jgi:hypothetical protein
MADLLHTWQYATAHLFAFAQPEQIDPWYEQAKRSAALWPNEHRARVAAMSESEQLVERIFRGDFIAEYRKARIDAELRLAAQDPPIDSGEPEA